MPYLPDGGHIAWRVGRGYDFDGEGFDEIACVANIEPSPQKNTLSIVVQA